MNHRPQSHRVLRTEVIWKRDYDEDDSDDRCPIDIALLKKSLKKGKRLLWSVALAFVVILAQHVISKWGDSDGMFSEPASNNYIVGDVTTMPQMNDHNRSYAIDALRHHHYGEVAIPKSLDNLANVDEPLKDGDVPYFFHAPRSMGQSIKDVLGQCIGMNTTNLTATIEGIDLAKKENLLNKGGVDYLFSQYFHEGATLFNKNRKGR